MLRWLMAFLLLAAQACAAESFVAALSAARSSSAFPPAIFPTRVSIRATAGSLANHLAIFPAFPAHLMMVSAPALK